MLYRNNIARINKKHVKVMPAERIPAGRAMKAQDFLK